MDNATIRPTTNHRVESVEQNNVEKPMGLHFVPANIFK